MFKKINFLAQGSIYFSCVILAILSNSAYASNEKSLKIMPIVVFTTTQATGGMVEKDLTLDWLKTIELWHIGSMKKKAKALYAGTGHDPKKFNPAVKAKSVYVAAGGKKLAIIKLNMDNAARYVTIIGLGKDKLHRVSCARGSNHDIPIWSGKCGSEIHKTFGIALKP